VFRPLPTRDGQHAFAGSYLHVAPGEGTEFLETEAGVEQEHHNSDVPDTAAALHRPAQRVLLTAIEPPRPPLLPWERFRQGRQGPCGQEARHGCPGQETFERGELAIHAAGLQPPLVHQEALIVPEIGRGNVCRGQLVAIRIPEPAGEGRQVTTVVLDRQGTALRAGEMVGEVFNSGASHSAPFRWLCVIRRVFRGILTGGGQDYTASRG
jgi:hypothetical protein